MKPRIALALVLLANLSVVPRLLAWNDTGHMTVALIAYRQLDDATRQKIDAILQQHPHYKLYLTANLPQGASEGEWAFMRAATWPDFVRPARPGSQYELFKGPEITKYHQAYWHYIDMPWVPPMDRQKIDPSTMPSHQPRSEPATQPTNILESLDFNAKELKSTTGEQQAVALAWTEHLIGDVHQPLHATTLYSPLYPTGDRGGNSIAIRLNGYVMNLHSFWDESMGTSDAYSAIAFLATDVTSDPNLAPEKLAQMKQDASFRSWADESHEYGIAFAYLNGRLRSASMSQFDAKEISADQVPGLPPGYEQNARLVARRRVAMAGYRLADQIKSALAGR